MHFSLILFAVLFAGMEILNGMETSDVIKALGLDADSSEEKESLVEGHVRYTDRTMANVKDQLHYYQLAKEELPAVFDYARKELFGVLRNIDSVEWQGDTIRTKDLSSAHIDYKFPENSLYAVVATAVKSEEELRDLVPSGRGRTPDTIKPEEIPERHEAQREIVESWINLFRDSYTEPVIRVFDYANEYRVECSELDGQIHVPKPDDE